MRVERIHQADLRWHDLGNKVELATASMVVAQLEDAGSVALTESRAWVCQPRRNWPLRSSTRIRRTPQARSARGAPRSRGLCCVDESFNATGPEPLPYAARASRTHAPPRRNVHRLRPFGYLAWPPSGARGAQLPGVICPGRLAGALVPLKSALRRYDRQSQAARKIRRGTRGVR